MSVFLSFTFLNVFIHYFSYFCISGQWILGNSNVVHLLEITIWIYKSFAICCEVVLTIMLLQSPCIARQSPKLSHTSVAKCLYIHTYVSYHSVQNEGFYAGILA